MAIKVLPDALAGDADRLARFEHEAQTLAALNHPHIAQIFGLLGLRYGFIGMLPDHRLLYALPASVNAPAPPLEVVLNWEAGLP